MQRQYIVKSIGNVSDWLSYAGGALIKVADSAGSTVFYFRALLYRVISPFYNMTVHFPDTTTTGN